MSSSAQLLSGKAGKSITTTTINKELFMPFNVTPLSSETRSVNVEDVAHAAWNFILLVLLVVICVAALIGNVLVVISVAKFPRLRSQVCYRFLAGLAVADICVAVLVMPLSIVYSQLGYWPLGTVACLFWQSCDVMCCTSSILHLCLVAADRYTAIAHPLVYPRLVTGKMIKGSIFLVWVTSVIISFLPIYRGWNTVEPLAPEQADFFGPLAYSFSVVNKSCLLMVNRPYAIVSSLTSFYLPFLVLCCLYTRIFLIAHRQALQMQQSQCMFYANTNNSPPRRMLSKHTWTNRIVFNRLLLFVRNKSHAVSNQTLSKASMEQTTPARDITTLERNIDNNGQIENHDVPSDHADLSLNVPKTANAQEGIAKVEKASGAIAYVHEQLQNQEQDPYSQNDKSRAFDSEQTLGNQLTKENPTNELRVKTTQSYTPQPGDKLTVCHQENMRPTSAVNLVLKKSRSSVSFTNSTNIQSVSFNAANTSASSIITANTTTNHMNATINCTKAQQKRNRRNANEDHDANARKHTTTRRRHAKAIKTVGLLLGCFAICWLPFFLGYAILPWCLAHCYGLADAMNTLTWIGYVNSAINPVLYCFLQREFITAFCRLLELLLPMFCYSKRFSYSDSATAGRRSKNGLTISNCITDRDVNEIPNSQTSSFRPSNVLDGD